MSSIGRAPGSDPGEVGSIPAAAASRAMRRSFFSLLFELGRGKGLGVPTQALPAPPRPIRRYSSIGRASGFDPEGDGSSPSAAASRRNAVSLFSLLYQPGRQGSPSRLGHMQQCDNGSRPAWKAGVPTMGLEVRVLSAAPQGGFDSRSCQRGPVRRERGSILCAGVRGNNPGLALVRQCCRRPAG